MTTTQASEATYMERYRAEKKVRRAVANAAIKKFHPSERLVEAQMNFDRARNELMSRVEFELTEFLQGRI